MSVSGVYETSRHNALPGQLPAAPRLAPKTDTPLGAPRPTVTNAATDGGPTVQRPPLTSGTPLRSAPRVLRIWLAPYEDSEGDLRDQTHIYVTVDRGRWQIEHTRRAIQDRFAPIRAVTPAAPSAGADRRKARHRDRRRDTSGCEAPGDHAVRIRRRRRAVRRAVTWAGSSAPSSSRAPLAPSSARTTVSSSRCPKRSRAQDARGRPMHSPSSSPTPAGASRRRPSISRARARAASTASASCWSSARRPGRPSRWRRSSGRSSRRARRARACRSRSSA